MRTSTTTPTGGDHAGAERAGPQLLDVKQTAELLNASARTVYRLAGDGRMPRPVRLGALVRWRRDEVSQWIAAGCPAVRHATTRKGGAS